ncbi:MAG: hypothetical protein ACXWDL_12660 [Nocardioides sp.]
MSDEKLSDKPEPEIEATEPSPGGADAIDEVPSLAGDERAPISRDLNPEQNPGVEDHIPDEIAALEDKKQEGEGDGASEPEKEPPV